MALRPGRDAAWVTVGDLGIRGISRLAVSRDGRWMAVVGQDQ
jgi:hypothetical protein